MYANQRQRLTADCSEVFAMAGLGRSLGVVVGCTDPVTDGTTALRRR